VQSNAGCMFISGKHLVDLKHSVEGQGATNANALKTYLGHANITIANGVRKVSRREERGFLEPTWPS
jgi:hypothetical protein